MHYSAHSLTRTRAARTHTRTNKQATHIDIKIQLTNTIFLNCKNHKVRHTDPQAQYTRKRSKWPCEYVFLSRKTDHYTPMHIIIHAPKKTACIPTKPMRPMREVMPITRSGGSSARASSTYRALKHLAPSCCQAYTRKIDTVKFVKFGELRGNSQRVQTCMKT